MIVLGKGSTRIVWSNNDMLVTRQSNGQLVQKTLHLLTGDIVGESV